MDLEFLARNDPIQFFYTNAFNHLLASAEEFKNFLGSLECSISKHGIANLNRFVGKIMLELENPQRAVPFLTRSVEIYKALRTATDPSQFTQVEADNLAEAEILLAQSYVRNCERHEDVEILLAGHLNLQSTPLTLKGLINAATAHNVSIESRLFTKSKEDMSMVLDHITACRDFLTKIPYDSEALIADLEILVYNYSCIIENTTLIQESFIRIQSLVNFCGPVLQFCVLKAIFRHRFLPPLDLISLSPMYIRNLNVRQQQGCVMANVNFVLGKLSIDIFNHSIAITTLRECLRIRVAELGENHVMTATVKVTLAQILIETADRSLPLNCEVFTLMEDSFRVFRNRSRTKFSCFADGLKSLATYFSDSGHFKQAQVHFEESIEVETAFCNNQHHDRVAFKRVALGKVYLQYKKWESSKEEFLSAIADLSCKIDEKAIMICGEALAFCGYCFFKLGDFGNAKIHFDWSREKFSTFSQGLEVSNLFLVLMLFDAEFRLWGLEERGVAKQIAITAFSYCLSNTNISHSSHPEVYFTLALFREEFNEEEIFPLSSRALYEESLRIGLQKFFSYHPYICDSYLALAKIDYNENKVDAFEDKLCKGLEIAFKIYEPNDCSIKMIFLQFEKLTNLRELVQTDYAKFINYVDLCTKVAVESNSEFIALFCAEFAQHLFETSSSGSWWVGRCRDLFKKSFKFFKKALGEKNEKTAKTEQMLARCYLKLGNLRKAEWHLYHSAIMLLQ